MRNKLRKQRYIPLYVYKAFSILYLFESKQHTYNSMNIRHKTLNDCLNLGFIYLYVFFFSLDLIKESDKMNLLSLNELKTLINKSRDIYIVKHPKAILAEYKNDQTKNLTFDSLNSLAKDHQVIIVERIPKSYYRGK
jgi:hypothetical protein